MEFIFYLRIFCTIGFTGRNVALLDTIAFLIRRLRGPWILAADWNFSPQVLLNSGWLRMVEGRIRATGAATCKGSEFDYFVVSSAINHAVLGVARITDTGAGPHAAVRMFIKGKLRSDYVRVLATPPKADAAQPLGCHSAQTMQQWDSVAPRTTREGTTQELLDMGFTTWIKCAEEALCEIGGLSGKARAKYICRSQGAKLVRRNAAGPVATNSLRISPISLAWKTIATWLGEVAAGLSTMAPASISQKAARARWLLTTYSWDRLGQSRHAVAVSGWLQQLSHPMLCDRAKVSWLKATATLIAKKAHMTAGRPKLHGPSGFMQARVQVSAGTTD